MPTYEYHCRACEDTFERFQKMTDPAVKECPSCGGPVRKVLHPPAIAFKGPGFHVNDYKSRPAPAAPPASEPDKSAVTAEPAAAPQAAPSPA